MHDRLFLQKTSLPKLCRHHLAIGMGKLALLLLRLLGRGATAMPGKTALTLSPNLLSALTAGRQVFLVTGTNGKTTTVRVLCSILDSAGYRVVTNPSGANLDSGLTTTLLSNMEALRQRGDQPLALVFEIDEAFFGKLASKLDPSVTVVTNFFRDQLDRFGELSHTRDLIARGLDQTSSKVVLCADDSLCASLARGREDDTLLFGMAAEGFGDMSSDAIHESAFCTFCGTKYTYDGMIYGHLGRFHCPGCGFSRPRPDLSFLPASGDGKGQIIDFEYAEETASAHLPIPGIHNAYNAAAALLGAVAGGIEFGQGVKFLSTAEAAFGRMERFTVDGKDVCLILVKNPVGMDRALDFVAAAPDIGGVMMLLNSNDPDGRDVSWIWDVHFEHHLPLGTIGVSGQRCHDMALRLYYAGKPEKQLITQSDYESLFSKLLADCPQGQCLYILPNYTAMLDLRAVLARRFDLKAFWR